MGLLAIILYLGVVIGSGALAWNISEPKSFLGAVGFIILWGVLGSVFGYLASIVMKAIDENKF